MSPDPHTKEWVDGLPLRDRWKYLTGKLVRGWHWDCYCEPLSLLKSIDAHLCDECGCLRPPPPVGGLCDDGTFGRPDTREMEFVLGRPSTHPVDVVAMRMTKEEAAELIRELAQQLAKGGDVYVVRAGVVTTKKEYDSLGW